MEEREKFDDAVEERLCKMLKDDPTSLIMWMLVQMGKMVVETNTATMDLKQKSTFDGQRYQIKAVISAKKVRGR